MMPKHKVQKYNIPRCIVEATPSGVGVFSSAIICAVLVATSASPVLARTPEPFHVAPIPKVWCSGDRVAVEWDLDCGDIGQTVWQVVGSTSLGWTMTWIEGTEVGTKGTTVRCGESEVRHKISASIDHSGLPEAQSGDWIVLQLHLLDPADVERRHMEKWALDLAASCPVLTGFDEYVEALNIGTVEAPGFAFAGQVFEAAPEHQGLPPWESPYVAPEIREELRLAAESQNSDETETSTFAASAVSLPSINGEAVPPENLGRTDGGCSSTSRASSGFEVLLILLLGTLLLLRMKRRWLKTDLTIGTAVVVGSLLMIPGQASAVTGTVYGYISVWDTRTPRDDDTGSRVTVGDPTDVTCTPWDSWCRFRGIPKAKVELMRLGDTTPRDIDCTDHTGFYMLQDSNWTTGYYWIRLTYLRDNTCSYPFETWLTTETGTTPLYKNMPVFQWAAQYHAIPNMSVNSAGDTTSPAGDYALYWKTVHDAGRYIQEEGDDRIERKLTSSPGTYDPITLRCYYCASAPGVASGQDICVRPAFTRTDTPAHELGHHYHWRVVSGFPSSKQDPWDWHGSEHASLKEAISSLIALLTWWDPDTASVVDILPGRPCDNLCTDDDGNPIPCVNVNDASVNRHNYYALWDFFDTDTAGTDAYGDYVDLTLKEVMDSLVSLKEYPGQPGENRTGNEHSEVDTATQCASVDDCNLGETCFKDTNRYNSCHTGDPHGSNIRDWAWHIANDQAGYDDDDLRETLESGQCMRGNRMVYPYPHGYFGD